MFLCFSSGEKVTIIGRARPDGVSVAIQGGPETRDRERRI